MAGVIGARMSAKSISIEGRQMSLIARLALVISFAATGCSGSADVDYKAAVREDGKGLVKSVDKAYMAKCKAAKAVSPEVARETDPYCRALRMARVCIKEKICP